jgi:hypothetical protein
MPRFNPVTPNVSVPNADTMIVGVSGTSQIYTLPLQQSKDILAGRDMDPRFLLWQIAAGLDAAGFSFAGKTPAQIVSAINALTNVVWAP